MTERSLPDLLDFIVDNRGRSCPTGAAGVPLIATKCIKEGQRAPAMDTVRFVDASTYANWFRAHPLPGDILFVCKGSPGRVAITPDPVPFCIAQDMVALRAKPSLVVGAYLYYRLRCADVQRTIANLHVGTMIPHFKKGSFGQLRFAVHDSLPEQAAIAEVLGALDDKIAANATLIAAADSVAGLKYEAMTDGGGSRPLSSLADFVNGKAFTKNATGTGRVVIRIAELNSGLGNSTVYNDLDVAENYLARPGDLLFAWSGSLTVQRWFRAEGIVNQHIFKVIPSDVPLWVVNGALRAKLGEFKGIAADKATTMGHIQRHHLDELVVVPPAEVIDREDAGMQALWDRALQAERESLTLVELRDALLPELMSGRLRVKDVDPNVEGAA